MRLRAYFWLKLFELNERFPAEYARSCFAKLNYQRYLVLRIWFMTKHNNATWNAYSGDNTPTSKTSDKSSR